MSVLLSESTASSTPAPTGKAQSAIILVFGTAVGMMAQWAVAVLISRSDPNSTLLSGYFLLLAILAPPSLFLGLKGRQLAIVNHSKQDALAAVVGSVFGGTVLFAVLSLLFANTIVDLPAPLVAGVVLARSSEMLSAPLLGAVYVRTSAARATLLGSARWLGFLGILIALSRTTSIDLAVFWAGLFALSWTLVVDTRAPGRGAILPFRLGEVRSLLPSAVALASATLAVSIGNSLPRYLLEIMSESDELALFGGVAMFFGAFLFLLESLNDLIVKESLGGEIGTGRKGVVQILLGVFAGAVVSLPVAIWIAPPILGTVFSNDLFERSAGTVFGLGFALSLMFPTILLRGVILHRGLERKRVATEIRSTLGACIVGLWSVPKFGASGAALMTAAWALLQLLQNLITLRRQHTQ